MDVICFLGHEPFLGIINETFEYRFQFFSNFIGYAQFVLGADILQKVCDLY